MSPHAWISLIVTLGVLVVLQTRRNVPADLLFLAGLMVVTMMGVITPAEAFAGFSNTAVITVGGLLVVASALRSTVVLDWVGWPLALLVGITVPALVPIIWPFAL